MSQHQPTLTNYNYLMNKTKPSGAYIFLMAVFIGSYFVFEIVGASEEYLYHIFHPELYLTWHNIFEGLSILTAFCIFTITYYSYKQTKNLRSLVLGCVFLSIGLVDAFHTLSYKGMPVFFTESSAPKATTFWIIARLISAVGILGALLIPRHKVSNVGSYWFVYISLSISVLALVVVTWVPETLPPMFIEGQGLTQTKIALEYFIMSLFLVAFFLLLREYHVYQDWLTVLLASAMIVSIYSELAFTMYRSVYDTYNLLGHIYKIVTYFLFFRALFVINITEPYLKLAKAEEKIKIHADHLEELVEARTEEIFKAKEILEKDLLYAREIQRALLPQKATSIPGVDIFALYLPYSQVGGDFYNFIPLSKTQWGFMIGDVAGHGVSSAMITVFVNQSIKLRNRRGNYNYKVLEPDKVLASFYNRYNQTDFPEEFYLGMYYALYDLETRVLTYSNGGLNCVPLRINIKGEIEALKVDKTFPICKLGPMFQPEFEQKEVVLHQGDKVFFYTDGIIEATNSKGEYFGEQRLRDFLSQNNHLSVNELGQRIEESINSFCGSEELKDDLTFFIIDIKT